MESSSDFLFFLAWQTVDTIRLSNGNHLINCIDPLQTGTVFSVFSLIGQKKENKFNTIIILHRKHKNNSVNKTAFDCFSFHFVEYSNQTVDDMHRHLLLWLVLSYFSMGSESTLSIFFPSYGQLALKNAVICVDTLIHRLIFMPFFTSLLLN